VTSAGALRAAFDLAEREHLLLRAAGGYAPFVDLKRRAAADPGRRRSKALRDQADIALLEGDVPEPQEGW
jgi:hypothetical protein